MQEILCVIALTAKIVAWIIFGWMAISAVKAKNSGNYLEAIYRLGWSMMILMFALRL